MRVSDCLPLRVCVLFCFISLLKFIYPVVEFVIIVTVIIVVNNLSPPSKNSSNFD